MNSRQHKTLTRIFEKPTRSDIEWNDVESLVKGLGGEVEQGKGSRVRFKLGEERMSIHRPHEKAIKLYVVKELQEFLTDAGVEV